jgi:hypothetical protein
MLQELVVQFVALAGFAALVAVVINILKALGIVGDGQAPKWSLAFNLVGFALFVLLGLVGIDFSAFDPVFAQLASILTAVLGIIGMLGVSRVSHAIVLGMPLIGKTHSPN